MDGVPWPWPSLATVRAEGECEGVDVGDLRRAGG